MLEHCRHRDNLVLGAAESLGQHRVSRYDELSVTVEWPGLTAPLVRGMPYATVFYEDKTPKLEFGGAVLSPSGPVTGTEFVVELNNGQQWRVYSSGPLSLQLAGSSLVASAPFTGSLR